MSKASEAKELFSSVNKILVISHLKPDLDAVASTLGMYYWLTVNLPDKEVRAVLAGEYAGSFKYIPGVENINWVSDVNPELAWAEGIVFVDGNHLTRFTLESKPELVEGKPSLCVDHHPNEADEYSLNFSDNSAASAAQLVYSLFFREHPETMTVELATILMYGIIGDTGTFKYLNHTRSETLIIAAELLRIGSLDIQTMELNLSKFKFEEIELMNKLLGNTRIVDLAGFPSFSYSFLELADADKYGLASIKGAGEKYKFTYLRQIDGYPWGFIVTPEEGDFYSLSFRSVPGAVNVKLLAGQFAGGGHILAAGGKYPRKLEGKDIRAEEVCLKIVDYIKSAELQLA